MHLNNYFCSTLVVSAFFLFDLVPSTRFKKRNGPFKKRYARFKKRNASFTNPIEIKFSGDVLETVYFKQLQNRSRAACIVSSLGYETGSEDLLKLLN